MCNLCLDINPGSRHLLFLTFICIYFINSSLLLNFGRIFGWHFKLCLPSTLQSLYIRYMSGTCTVYESCLKSPFFWTFFRWIGFWPLQNLHRRLRPVLPLTSSRLPIMGGNNMSKICKKWAGMEWQWSACTVNSPSRGWQLDVMSMLHFRRVQSMHAVGRNIITALISKLFSLQNDRFGRRTCREQEEKPSVTERDNWML